MLKVNHALVSSSGSLALFALTNPGLMAAPAENVITYALVLAGATVGAVTPDMDIVIPSIIPELIFNVLTAPFPKLRKKKIAFGHRTYTHSLLAVGFFALLTTLSWLIPEKFVFYLLLGHLFGYIFHLIADMMTVSGVPLLWFFNNKKFHVLPTFLRIVTGKSAMERVYAVMMFMAGLYVFYIHLGL